MIIARLITIVITISSKNSDRNINCSGLRHEVLERPDSSNMAKDVMWDLLKIGVSRNKCGLQYEGIVEILIQD